MFFRDAIQDPIFFASMSKNSIVGPPSKSSGRPNGTQNLPSDAKTSIKSDQGVGFSRFWNRLASKRLPEEPPGFILNDLLWIGGPFRLFFMAVGTNSAKPSSIKLNAKYPQRFGKELRNTCNNERSPRKIAWHFAISEITSAATNRKLQNQVEAVCAPHGAQDIIIWVNKYVYIYIYVYTYISGKCATVAGSGYCRKWYMWNCVASKHTKLHPHRLPMPINKL